LWVLFPSPAPPFSSVNELALMFWLCDNVVSERVSEAMSFTSAIPYVFQRGNLYCFRWTFSRPLAQVFGKRELRRSLKTGYKAVAMRRAMELAIRLRLLAYDFDSMREITPQNLHILLNQYFLDALCEREDWRARADRLAPADVDNETTAFQFLQHDNQERLRLHDYRGLRPVIEMLAADWGVTAPTEDSETYSQLCRGLLRTDAQTLALPGVIPIKPRTANKYFVRVAQFFTWAKDQG
jgi:hypothetical protein